jgi:hypothetical protein
MLTRNQIPLFTLAAALLAVFLLSAAVHPGLAVQAARLSSIDQTVQAQSTPNPLQSVTASPTPETFDDRPVERNPFLIAGGVLIFLVITFGVWRYSRPPQAEG